jgi:hypothetical protein
MPAASLPWQTDEASYPQIGKTAPAFSTTIDGAPVTQDVLRDRWTILAFWGLWSDDSIADARYMQALNSAAAADPDLEFLTIHIPPGPDRAEDPLGGFPSLKTWFDDQGGAWPTAIDEDGSIARAFGVNSPPVYLLIGPDLTIEGYRTELSATPDDGIKAVIRGVAEIRKQIAAPQ